MQKKKGGFPCFTIEDYTVTKDGKVINNRWNRIVKPQKNGKGYLRVYMCGRMWFVHRLVAEKYIPNPENKPQVNHKDGNKLNNNANNLEWVTNKQNRDHAVKNKLYSFGEDCPWSKLKKADVDFIRNHPEIKNAEFAKLFGVSRSTIYSVKHYKSWNN